MADIVGRTAEVVTASSAGAVLDTDLRRGGGTDDTIALQAVLDRARSGLAVHLVIDGPALVTGLDVYGDTVIEFTSGGGLYLADRSCRAIIRNAHRTEGPVVDERIAIRGGFLNGNRSHQIGRGFTGGQAADGTFISGIQFIGVRDLTIAGVTIWSARTLGIQLANVCRVGIRDVRIDHAGPTIYQLDTHAMTCGIEIYGPASNITIDTAWLRTGDDAIALIAARGGHMSGLVYLEGFVAAPGLDPDGEIVDVIIDNVQLIDAWQGVRLGSHGRRVDRVIVSNVTGTVRGHYLANLSPVLGIEHPTDFGTVIFENITVDRISAEPDFVERMKAGFAAAVESGRRDAAAEDFNHGDVPCFSVNGRVEQICLRGVLTTVVDDRPVVRIGPSARVEHLKAELIIRDPLDRATPLVVDEGGRAELIDLDLTWVGSNGVVRRDPIARLHGTVVELRRARGALGEAPASRAGVPALEG